MKKEDNKAKKRSIKIGKHDISYNTLEIVIFCVFFLIYFISPKCYSITTALYNKGSKSDQENVVKALGSTNTEERFEIYFQWYNVVHELGHGLLYYNNGAKVDIADEEQLVNDFAVAYWKKYGEEDKLNELLDIVTYAVEHVGTNYENGVDYLKLGKENSNDKRFNPSFFNFNDYGWFQFSSVKHSFEADKSLEDVLKEMGFENFKLPNDKKLIYDEIDTDISTKIILDAVNEFRNWGLKFPNTAHHFSKDPNMNASRSTIKYLGLIEIPDYVYIFKQIFV